MADEPKPATVTPIGAGKTRRLNRNEKRAAKSHIAKGTDLGLQIKIRALEEKLVANTQLILALLLDRDVPDAPMVFKIDDLVYLNPAALVCETDRKAGLCTLSLKGDLIE